MMCRSRAGCFTGCFHGRVVAATDSTVRIAAFRFQQSGYPSAAGKKYEPGPQRKGNYDRILFLFYIFSK